MSVYSSDPTDTPQSSVGTRLAEHAPAPAAQPSTERPWRWLHAALYSIVVLGTVTVVAPWIAHTQFPSPVRLPFGPSPFAGIALIALGIALYLWCLWGFVEAGRGTPSFLAPPERLVVSGPYRYVRNPMYLAAFMILTGEVALVPASRVIEWALGTIASVVLFVVVFEEPRLRRKFGVRYERYCATVPRWLPALRAQSSRETAQTLAPVTSARAIPGGADTPPLP